MKFSVFLKKCRIKNHLTQEKLIHELYSFDKIFAGLNDRTISRWENDKTTPNIDRQLSLIKYFQTINQQILPCFNDLDEKDIENQISKINMKNLIGFSKEHILNYPTKSLDISSIIVSHVKNADNIEEILDLPYETIKNLTGNIHNLSLDILKNWALNTSNLFLVSQYKKQFIGMFFSLRLKPQVFNQVINFELELKDIVLKDFATFDEKGSNLLITFFSFNQEICNSIFAHFYANIIANQDNIENIGVLAYLQGGKKVAQNMHMSFYKEKRLEQDILASYKASLNDVLINKDFIRLIFN